MASTVTEISVYATEYERRVVHLRDVEGMKWTEIGRQLGRDRKNCQHAYQRAKARILEQGPASSQELQELQEACDEALEKARGKIDDKMLSEGASEVALKALWHILHDKRKWDRATIRDFSAVSGLMIDKRQLLRGEPTQITKIQDIRKLDEQLEILLKELQRRGELIDVTPEKAE